MTDDPLPTRAALIRVAREMKTSTPCADCGVQYPYQIMSWDHRDPAEKGFNISDYPRVTMAEFLAELAKCDVVCFNCHGLRPSTGWDWKLKGEERAAHRAETAARRLGGRAIKAT